MKSIKLFWQFFKESYHDLIQNFQLFVGSYVAFVLVDFLASIPWVGLGQGENSFLEILNSIVVGILNLIVVVNVILIEKSRVKFKEKESLIYAAPTYLIYTLYSTIIIVLGILAFVVPGIVAAIIVGMVPLASVLIDNDSVNYFKVSYKMAKKDAVMITCFGVASLLVELPGFAFDFIPEWKTRLGFNLLYSFFDGVLMIALTLASVRVFYHLKRLLNDPS